MKICFKGTGAGLLSDMKSGDLSVDFTFYPLATGPSCVISTPEESIQSCSLFGTFIIELIIHIAISVLPGTYLHLSQVKHVRVKCLAE